MSLTIFNTSEKQKVEWWHSGPGGGEGGDEELSFKGHRVSVIQDDKEALETRDRTSGLKLTTLYPPLKILFRG